MKQEIIVVAACSGRRLVLSCIAVAAFAVQACSAPGDDEFAAAAVDESDTTLLVGEAASAFGKRRLAQSAICDDAAVCDDGNECTQEACVNGICVLSLNPAGTLCSGGACDGGGQCLAIPSCDPALCDDGNECTQEACVNDVCVFSLSPAGAACSGGSCDGAGQCLASGCSDALDCPLGQLCFAGVCSFIR